MNRLGITTSSHVSRIPACQRKYLGIGIADTACDTLALCKIKRHANCLILLGIVGSNRR